MNIPKTLYRREFSAYLFSPVAFIFIGTFLLVSLFTFFWVNQFFERNIADLRPLFQWLPILLIFLVSSLTMKSWAEEKSQGTFELLMTWPARAMDLVMGKFFGVMGLVVIALVLTLPLVITVSFLGDLDFGPVVGGYLAALFLASAYTAMGLWISSTTQNQVIALIGTALLGSFFYLIGSPTLTHLVPERLAEVFRLLGTGSRFESVSRGVLDLRDVAYYATLTVIFGTLNVLSLLRSRWSLETQRTIHRQTYLLIALVLVNLIVLNFWISPLSTLRLDLTARGEYSISPVTKNVLATLAEPLEIRFYSNEVHPLLDPLRPQVRDLIKEYEIVSKGKVKSFSLDPSSNVEIERELNETYGIKPVPFKIPSRNEMKIVNSYFNVVIKYGDQHAVLGFDDLIEISVSGMSDIQVKLRNLEYDLTKSIKKAVQGFQTVEDIFAAIPEPIVAKILVTPNTLPDSLQSGFQAMQKVYGELEKTSKGKFKVQVIDLDEIGQRQFRETIVKEWGVKPFSASLISRETFFLHTVIVSDKSQSHPDVIYPAAADLNEREIKDAIESALKRRAKGFLKTVGFFSPPPNPMAMMNPHMMRQPPAGQYRMLNEMLSQDYLVKPVEFSAGSLPQDIDVLFMVKPANIGEKEKFAIDQFLMRGGTVIVATGAFEMNTGHGGNLSLQAVQNGIADLSESYGIGIQPSLVMDMQNEPFPVPVTRDLGGFQVQEMKLLRYPFFVDIRENGMAKEHLIFSGLPSLTLHFASPLKIAPKKEGATVESLAFSSAKSWVETSTDIQPNLNLYSELGFKTPEEYSRSVLVAMAQGPLTSAFQGKPIPQDSNAGGMLAVSPSESRFIVIGSGEFLSDTLLGISQQTGQERYMNNLNFAKNVIDWALEDTALLTIRSRGSFARTLRPYINLLGVGAIDLNPPVKNAIEIINYGLVLGLLGVLMVWVRMKKNAVRPFFQVDDETKSNSQMSNEEAA